MKRLPSSQLEIMLVIWEAKKPIRRKEIKEMLTNKEWKVTTVNTFLSRLIENNFLKCEQHGKEYYYSPMIEKDEYLKYEGNTMLKKLYNNSVKNFIAAICGGENLTEKDLNELQEYLKQLKEMNKDVK